LGTAEVVIQLKQLGCGCLRCRSRAGDERHGFGIRDLAALIKRNLQTLSSPRQGF
jgi:hypothetical protein